ncbi:MAG TPA: radical SAM protein [Nitrospinota bacterium]|jgi:radical SAM protein with 4Fe4S-binding SPASM domain|nr:radical SAM protein [Nitrospinota bacterium]|tara:strand:+ start:1990 stop:3078 length:1089 start_codon:yes stop_codon:yes gene_type:complete
MLSILFNKSPFQFIHYITNRCNAKCEHCFYWEKLNKGKQLSIDEIIKITESMGKIYQLILTGGEPFLREEIVEIVKAYYKNNKIQSLNIPTNGILKKIIVERCKEILKICPNINFSLNLSIDGFKELHDEIRGVDGCYENAINVFKETVKLKEKYSRFNVTFLTTLTGHNQHEILKLYKFIKEELKANLFQLNFLRGKPKKINLSSADFNIYREVNEQSFNNYKVTGGSPCFIKIKSWLRNRLNRARYNRIIETASYNKFITPCYAGYLNAVMYEDGDVFPCELLDQKIGNIRDFDYDFGALWNSEKNKRIRSFIKDTKCFCTHECFLTTNILFNPKQVLKMLLVKSENGKSISTNIKCVNS